MPGMRIKRGPYRIRQVFAFAEGKVTRQQVPGAGPGKLIQSSQGAQGERGAYFLDGSLHAGKLLIDVEQQAPRIGLGNVRHQRIQTRVRSQWMVRRLLFLEP